MRIDMVKVDQFTNETIFLPRCGLWQSKVVNGHWRENLQIYHGSALPVPLL